MQFTTNPSLAKLPSDASAMAHFGASIASRKELALLSLLHNQRRPGQRDQLLCNQLLMKMMGWLSRTCELRKFWFLRSAASAG
jgi:hypothetical protein